jgi:ABC-2 type transport system ATP-binding protein
MEEADRVADRVAIIDQGKIMRIGTPKEIKKAARADNLEDAFLKLTGKKIRDESASEMDSFRMRRRIMGR